MHKKEKMPLFVPERAQPKGDRCALCNSRSHSILFSNLYGMGRSFEIVKCNKCGLVFRLPKLSEEEMNELYTRGYYQRKSIFPLVKGFFPRLRSLVCDLRFQKIYNILEKKARILDVGCGTGELLTVFERKGYECYGLDTSEDAFELAKANLGRKACTHIFNRELRECHFPNSSFDLILLSHVIEHLPNPSKELKEIHRILADDGILFISTPNSESFEFKIAKQEWYGLDFLVHPYLYSPKTITMLLKKNEFSIISISYPFSSYAFSLFFSLKKKIIDNRLKLFNPFLLPPLLLTSIVFRLVFYNSRGIMEVLCKKEKKEREEYGEE
jgi:2-polyprenyl-3-methyl-5-hydroxy-6-metoxy-1,4-benzoquinol methylase